MKRYVTQAPTEPRLRSPPVSVRRLESKALCRLPTLVVHQRHARPLAAKPGRQRVLRGVNARNARSPNAGLGRWP